MWFDWGCSNLCLQRWAWSQDWPLRTLAFPWPQTLVQRWACDWNEANEISFYDFWWSPWKRGCLFLPELLSCWNVSLDRLWSSLLPLGKSRAENRASKKATVCCHGRDSFFLTFFENLERFLFSSVLINCVSWDSFTCLPMRLVDKYDIRIGIGFLVHCILYLGALVTVTYSVYLASGFVVWWEVCYHMWKDVID